MTRWFAKCSRYSSPRQFIIIGARLTAREPLSRYQRLRCGWRLFWPTVVLLVLESVRARNGDYLLSCERDQYPGQCFYWSHCFRVARIYRSIRGAAAERWRLMRTVILYNLDSFPPWASHHFHPPSPQLQRQSLQAACHSGLTVVYVPAVLVIFYLLIPRKTSRHNGQDRPQRAPRYSSARKEANLGAGCPSFC